VLVARPRQRSFDVDASKRGINPPYALFAAGQKARPRVLVFACNLQVA